MDRKPAISVIIPFYNVGEALFSKCIDSILKQTFRDFELLIIDDGSSDEFAGILDRTEKLDQRIRVIHRPNGGVSSARNLGVELATGSFITFIDADDIVHPGFLSESYAIITKEEADMVIGTVRDFDMNRDTYENLVNSRAGQPFTYTEYGPQEITALKPILVASNRLMRFPTGGYISRGPVARLVRTETARKVCFPEGIQIGEDVIWNQRILSVCSKVIVAENIWYYYFYAHNTASAIHRYREDAIKTIRDAGLALLSTIDISDNELYRAFCSRLFSQTRLIICQAYLTNRQNRASFFEKYRVFMQLKKQEPWSLITGRLLKIGSRDEKFYYLLLKSNLYFPLAYIKDRLGR